MKLKNQLLNMGGICKLTGISRFKLNRFIEAKVFPDPAIQREPGRLAQWRTSDIEAWVAVNGVAHD